MTETTETAPASDAGASGARKGGLNAMLLPELKQLAGGLGIKATGMRKGALIEAIKTAQGGGQNSKRDGDGGGSKKGDTAPAAAAERSGDGPKVAKTDDRPDQQDKPQQGSRTTTGRTRAGRATTRRTRTVRTTAGQQPAAEPAG